MIAATIIMKNEEQTIARCIHSLKDYVSMILIADTGSTDQSVAIAKSLGATVYDYQWQDDFAAARNYIMARSTADYNLIIDADEWVVRWDQQAVEALIGQGAIGRIKIINQIKTEAGDSSETAYLDRLLPKGVHYQGAIHEQPDSMRDRVTIPIELYHDGYYNKKQEKRLRNRQLLLKELEKTPSDPYYLYQISKEYLYYKEYDRAGSYLERAYKIIEPRMSYYEDFIFSHLVYCVKTGNLERGLEIIEQDEPNLGDSMTFYYACGQLFFELVLSDPEKYIGFVNLVEDSYQRAIAIGESRVKNKTELKMELGVPMYNLADFYEKTGQINQAKHWFERAYDRGMKIAGERRKSLE